MKRTILTWLDANFEDVICGFLLIAIMFLLMIQVIVRVVTGQGLTVPEELGRFFFLYLTYFGASLTAYKGAHIRVTAQLRYVPKRVAFILLLLADVIWLVFNAFVIYQGIRLIQSMATFPMLSGGMMVDLRYVFVAVPIGFTLLEFRVLRACWSRFKGGVNAPIADKEGDVQ